MFSWWRPAPLAEPNPETLPPELRWDIRGKHVLITGANTGIGRATAVGLAARGARLTLACRSLERTQAVLDEINTAHGAGTATFEQLDQTTLAGTAAFARRIAAKGEAIDVLLLNAGAVPSTAQTSPDGLELTWAINHFATYVLTTLLLDTLRRPGTAARIVVLASEAHKFHSNSMLEEGYDFFDAGAIFSVMGTYGSSKMGNMLFTRELARRLTAEGSRITCNCVHPGTVSTDLGRDAPWWALKLLAPIQYLFFKTPEQGAQCSIWAATSNALSDRTGEYLIDNYIAQASTYAMDPENARRMWDITERIVQQILARDPEAAPGAAAAATTTTTTTAAVPAAAAPRAADVPLQDVVVASPGDAAPAGSQLGDGE